MKQVYELIRGELSAIKSIDSILGKINNESERSQLNSIRQDHVIAVDKLKKFSSTEVKETAESAGPWGAFASAFTGGASFFGDKAALKALKVGEEHGLNEYREALKEGTFDTGLKQMIQTDLLPTQEQHLRTIDSYLQ
jgi:Domain of unknown function (DUF2383)